MVADGIKAAVWKVSLRYLSRNDYQFDWNFNHGLPDTGVPPIFNRGRWRPLNSRRAATKPNLSVISHTLYLYPVLLWEFCIFFGYIMGLCFVVFGPTAKDCHWVRFRGIWLSWFGDLQLAVWCNMFIRWKNTSSTHVMRVVLVAYYL